MYVDSNVTFIHERLPEISWASRESQRKKSLSSLVVFLGLVKQQARLSLADVLYFLQSNECF